jgi:hypothetical protein
VRPLSIEVTVASEPCSRVDDAPLGHPKPLDSTTDDPGFAIDQHGCVARSLWNVVEGVLKRRG